MDRFGQPRAEHDRRRCALGQRHPEIWKSRPVKGDVGHRIRPGVRQIFNYVQQGTTAHYAESARGAYQAFFDSNIQADWVHIDHVRVSGASLPYPMTLKQDTVKKLNVCRRRRILISEGCLVTSVTAAAPGATQPNKGLDKLFGARDRRRVHARSGGPLRHAQRLGAITGRFSRGL